VELPSVGQSLQMLSQKDGASEGVFEKMKGKGGSGNYHRKTITKKEGRRLSIDPKDRNLIKRVGT